jgi:uncharacterized membrane-anchored protein
MLTYITLNYQIKDEVSDYNQRYLKAGSEGFEEKMLPKLGK